MKFSRFNVEKMSQLGVFSYSKATMELTLVGVTYCFRHQDYVMRGNGISTVLEDAGYLTKESDALKAKTYIGTIEMLKDVELDIAVEDDFEGKVKFYEYVRDSSYAKKLLGRYHNISLDYIMGRIFEDVAMMLYTSENIGEAHNIQTLSLDNRYRLHLAKMVYFNSHINVRLTDITNSLYDAGGIAVLSIGGILYNLKLPYNDAMSVSYSQEFGLFEVRTVNANMMFFTDCMVGYELYKGGVSVPYMAILEKDIHYFEDATNDNKIKWQILMK